MNIGKYCVVMHFVLLLIVIALVKVVVHSLILKKCFVYIFLSCEETQQSLAMFS